MSFKYIWASWRQLLVDERFFTLTLNVCSRASFYDLHVMPRVYAY